MTFERDLDFEIRLKEQRLSDKASIKPKDDEGGDLSKKTNCQYQLVSAAERKADRRWGLAIGITTHRDGEQTAIEIAHRNGSQQDCNDPLFQSRRLESRRQPSMEERKEY